MPVVDCALTAPAVFDGYRVRTGSVGDALKTCSDRADCRDGVETNYFSASVDWSTVTPGPMVELSEIFCRYMALGGRRLGLDQVEQQRLQVVLQRRGVEARPCRSCSG